MSWNPLDSNLIEKFRSQLLTPVEVITLFPPTQNHFDNLPSTNQNKQTNTDMSAHSEDGELPDSEGELSPSDDESSSAQTQNQPKETQSYTLFNTSSRAQVCSTPKGIQLNFYNGIIKGSWVRAVYGSASIHSNDIRFSRPELVTADCRPRVVELRAFDNIVYFSILKS